MHLYSDVKLVAFPLDKKNDCAVELVQKLSPCSGMHSVFYYHAHVVAKTSRPQFLKGDSHEKSLKGLGKTNSVPFPSVKVGDQQSLSEGLLFGQKFQLKQNCHAGEAFSSIVATLAPGVFCLSVFRVPTGITLTFGPRGPIS